jgi:hypothetical protein
VSEGRFPFIDWFLVKKTFELLFPKANMSLVHRQMVNVRHLRGFRKTHSIPTRKMESTSRFIGTLVRPELDADLTSIHRQLRSELNLKRKDMEVGIDPYGCGILTTTKFRYQHSFEMSENHCDQLTQLRQLDDIFDLNLLVTAEFESVFGNRFHGIEIDFGIEIEVEELIDAIEEMDDSDLNLDYNLEATQCNVELNGIPEVLSFESQGIRLHNHRNVSSSQLIWNLKEFQTRLVSAFESAGIL